MVIRDLGEVLADAEGYREMAVYPGPLTRSVAKKDVLAFVHLKAKVWDAMLQLLRRQYT